ncbi:MAG: hypothetical protein WA021_02255 [Minisyncoccia bacterium]
MKNSLCAGFGALLLIIIPFVAFTAEFRTGDQPSLSQGQTVQDDLYMAGGNVMSAGTVRGDLIVGGGTVLVNGPVTGDLLIGGGNVTIAGEVTDDLRAGGGNILVQSVVRGDVILGGGQINLTGTRIGGDVAIGGGSVRIESAVGGDVKIGGGDIYINAPIAGNVEINAEKVTLGPRANIAGDFTYKATEAVIMEDGAVVRGETSFEERAGREEVKKGAIAALAAFASLWMLAKFLMSLVGAFALAFFFKRYTQEMIATAATQPVAEFVRGLVVVIVLPIVSVILLISIIGIPLGVVGLLTTIILSIFGSFAAPILLGSLIHKSIKKPAGYVVNWKTVLLGVVVYFILALIPIVGWLAKCVILLMALGAALNIKWSVAKQWR